MKDAHLFNFPAVDNVGLGREVIQVVVEDAAQRWEVLQVNFPDRGLWRRLSRWFLFGGKLHTVEMWKYGIWKNKIKEKKKLFYLQVLPSEKCLGLLPPPQTGRRPPPAVCSDWLHGKRQKGAYLNPKFKPSGTSGSFLSCLFRFRVLERLRLPIFPLGGALSRLLPFFFGPVLLRLRFHFFGYF